MRISLENKKNILMLFLLLLCVFQMGILWSDKNPGIPFPFSSQRFWPKVESVKLDAVKGLYFKPERIMISDGTGVYWPLESGAYPYTDIWNDFMGSYLKQIMEKPAGDYNEKWDSLVQKKCIILEFYDYIPVGIIQWMSGTQKPVSTPYRQIYKIAVFPSEEIDYNKNTIYVTDDGDKAYKYVVTIEQGLKKEDYVNIIHTIKENDTIIPLRRFSNYFPTIKNDELLGILSDDKEEKIIWDLLVRTPDEIGLQRDNIDRIQEYLLESGSAYTDLSDDGSNVLFSDDEEIIRYYKNGFFDYRYRKLNAGTKGAVEEALEKALTFIEYRRKNMVQKADIRLSGIDMSNEDRYVFTFDYCLYDMAIKVMDETGVTKEPAITISANRERVLEAKWYIKTFEPNDFYKSYDLNFISFFEKQLAKEYPVFLNDFQPQDISILYLFNGVRAEPYWLVRTENEGDVYLRMRWEGE